MRLSARPLQLLLAFASALSTGCADETPAPTLHILVTDWTSVELRRSLELWAFRAFQDAVPETRVQILGPREEVEAGSVMLTVESSPAQDASMPDLALLLSGGLSIHGRELPHLNSAYKATKEGQSTCLLLIDAPSIRVAATAANSSASGGEALLRFPSWLQGKTSGYRYIYPRFEGLRAVRVQFGPAWEKLPEMARKRLLRHCGGQTAFEVLSESGMTIVPAHLELVE